MAQAACQLKKCPYLAGVVTIQGWTRADSQDEQLDALGDEPEQSEPEQSETVTLLNNSKWVSVNNLPPHIDQVSNI